jgi:predicted nicotinamide N-methyase
MRWNGLHLYLAGELLSESPKGKGVSMGKGKAKTEIYAYGLRVLRSTHSEIRKLKRTYHPSFHGFRIWPSSWLLIHFLRQQGMQKGLRVMEVGCGWGLAGIYCAKRFEADVTGIDIDARVFPFLKIHARINYVQINTIQSGFDGITERDLEDTDILIGSDICFWDTLEGSLKALITRAVAKGLRVLIADPGRPPFDSLGEYFASEGNGDIFDYTLSQPHPIQGRILSIGCFPKRRPSCTQTGPSSKRMGRVTSGGT